MKKNLDLFRSTLVNPWGELASLQRRMDRLFDEFASPTPATPRTDADFMPACDLEETDAQYLISVDVPGIPKDKIKVEVSGDTLTISGEHKEERKEEKGERKLFERYQGRFARSFTLPGMAHADKVEANYLNGVLKIAVPKQETNRARQIQIREGKTEAIGQTYGKPSEGKDKKTGETRAA